MSDHPHETTNGDGAESGQRTFLVPLEMPGLRATVTVSLRVETSEDCPGEIHQTGKKWNQASRPVSNRELAMVALKIAKTATATPHGKSLAS